MAGSPDDCFSLPPPRAASPLLVWLLEALKPMNRTRVKQLLRHGRVSVNGAVTTRHDTLVGPGDRIEVARSSPPTDRSLEEANIVIVMEDDAFIAMDKPAGLLTVATAAERMDTAFARLNAHLTSRGMGRPFVVHRLDRETSGLLLFARSVEVRDFLQEKWEGVEKTYLAIVDGMPPSDEGKVENYLVEGRDLRVRARHDRKGARRAVTHYRVLGTHGRYTLVEVDLETGRKHQIRVHLADLGCPVIGDPLYGRASNPAGRMGLHAHRLSFEHPINGSRVELTSPLPAVLQRIMDS